MATPRSRASRRNPSMNRSSAVFSGARPKTSSPSPGQYRRKGRAGEEAGKTLGRLGHVGHRRMRRCAGRCATVRSGFATFAASRAQVALRRLGHRRMGRGGVPVVPRPRSPRSPTGPACKVAAHGAQCLGGSQSEHLASHGAGPACKVAAHGAQCLGGSQSEHLASHGAGPACTPLPHRPAVVAWPEPGMCGGLPLFLFLLSGFGQTSPWGTRPKRGCSGGSAGWVGRQGRSTD